MNVKICVFCQYQGSFHVIALTWDLSSPIRYEEFTVSGALQEREEIILLKNPNLYNQIKQAGLNERQCVSELL